MKKLFIIKGAFIFVCLVSSYAYVSDEGASVNFVTPDSVR